VIGLDIALSRSSRPDQLLGLLQRAGFAVPGELAGEQSAQGLRVAEA
jgi:hypothetical protein